MLRRSISVRKSFLTNEKSSSTNKDGTTKESSASSSSASSLSSSSSATPEVSVPHHHKKLLLGKYTADAKIGDKTSVADVTASAPSTPTASRGVVNGTTSTASRKLRSSGSGRQSNAATPQQRRRMNTVLAATHSASSRSNISNNNSPANINPVVPTTAQQRLVEYVCIVSSQPRWTNQQLPDNNSSSRKAAAHSSPSKSPTAKNNNGNIHMPGHHKQSSSKTPEYTFQPVITGRYPAIDYSDNPLNPMILQFCYPTGDVIVPVSTYSLPKIHYFVLTLGNGRKLYATCLTVLEEYNNAAAQKAWASVLMSTNSGGNSDAAMSSGQSVECSVDMDSEGSGRLPTLYIPKVICLLSTWPYLSAFREYLSQLYRIACTSNAMTAPLERYIQNLCLEIPAPPPGAYELQLQILDSTIRFWAPPAKLPIAYVALPYSILFECLDLDHIVVVWHALMLERKVLLLSSQYSVLTVCAEILCSLLFPLKWSHLYVPLLPRMLCPMLDAPVPYLCGVVRENWLYAQQFVSPETYVVDLDKNYVSVGQSTQDEMPYIPSKKLSKLQTSLTDIIGDYFWKRRGLGDAYAEMMQRRPQKRSMVDLRAAVNAQHSLLQWNEKLDAMDNAFNLAYTPSSPNLGVKERSQWDNVQEAFLRFFVTLFKDYRRFLNIPTINKTDESTCTPYAPPPIQNCMMHPTDDGDQQEHPSFDHEAFLLSLKPTNVPFLSELCGTQHFDDFLTRRMYSPGEPDLQFFDQSIDAKLNRSKLKVHKVDTPILRSAEAHKVLKQLAAVAPNEQDLPQEDDDDEGYIRCGNEKKRYQYKHLPQTFDETLFCEPRPIPQMISAEFDRQSILISKLRAFTVVDTNGATGDGHDTGTMNGDIPDFCSGDYDTSPEVAACTVFMFVYGAMVGREWQKYTERRHLEDAKLAEEAAAASPHCNGVASCHMADNLIEDMSMGCCSGCPEDGSMNFQAALYSISDGVEAVYQKFFCKPAEHLSNLVFPNDGNGDEQNRGAPLTGNALAEYEEAREVSSAQLELGFETLSTMTLRGLDVDSDAYLSLMESCGRCGDRPRALKLVELMKTDGFVADSEILSYFMTAFAKDVTVEGEMLQSSASGTIVHGSSEIDADAYARHLKKGYDSLREKEGVAAINAAVGLFAMEPTTETPKEEQTSDSSDDDDDSGSESSDNSAESTAMFMSWFNYHPFHRPKKKKKKKKHKSESRLAQNTPVTRMLSRQIELGESLLDFVYPELDINTSSDCCPLCSYTLTEDDVVSGWRPCAFQDYTSQCPNCKHRFVPRFVVQSASPNFVGSQGMKTPLFCEFLSPWVLRKEFQHFIKGSTTSIDDVLNPKWRSGTDIRATLFWNLIAVCRRNRLPFTFLLQGNFPNRLVLPRMPDEV